MAEFCAPGGLSRFACVLAFTAVAALAESAGGTFPGRVVDPAKAPIEGAAVSVRSASLTVSTLTGSTGEFSFDLVPGSYTLQVTAPGFTPISMDIDVPAGGAKQRDFLLEVAGVHETVVVSEAPDYAVTAVTSGTKTLTLLRDIPQAITVVSQEQMKDQLMMSIADVVRYVPGIAAHQGENNRDQVIIRGNNSSADFFVNGVRDDVQYYRDLYNLEQVEALKGPNAMIFGRGGGGGVINRVTKSAGFVPYREVSAQGGSFGNKRFTADLDQPLNKRVAFRMNGMYENSDSFRDFGNLNRFGISPTLTVLAGKRTRITLGYEHFEDRRVSDRGIPSYQNRPVDVPVSTFYGNPDDSRVRANVNIGSAAIEHQAGRLNLRNRLQIADYDRSYQNFVPGAVTADRSMVALSAYNNATARRNFFNQTDLTYTAATGRLRHTLLSGVEVGIQETANFRKTGYFNNTDTSISIPFDRAVVSTPTTFRQSATDADNHVTTNVAAAFLQDQVEITSWLQAIAGVRVDRFDLRYRNNRTGERLSRVDKLVSPRAGLVLKPVVALSLYGSFGVSFLPGSGDQFSSLTNVTQQVKPERFTNYEIGAKWDANRSLSLTAAVYILDRTNTRSTDPNDPTRIVQTGSQRSNGIEAGATGNVTRKWRIAGGFTWQDAFVTSATTAARAGAQVAQVPHVTFSLWNNYQVLRRFGAGLGIVNRAEMFAAIDNTVVLPAYTRVDAAVYYSLTERVRLQANAENLFNTRYYQNADNNNNISPGSPRCVRMALITRF